MAQGRASAEGQGEAMNINGVSASLCSALWLACAGTASAADPVPVRPAGLVQGGAFIDLIRPIPVDDSLTTNCWGVADVKPRVVNNGIEDPKWSYWCASSIRGPDGREHLFTVRWPQAKGHTFWVRSVVVHAVADQPTGPFKVVEELGPGHNVDVHQTRDGTYVVSVSGRHWLSKDLNGPWKLVPAEFDVKESSMTNKTFARREDGSFLMILRSGSVWLSDDGLQPYRRIQPTSVYPFDRAGGSTAFEDPVIWRDEVQYHMMVNNWPKRTAFYGRSKDGLHWTWDDFKAFDNDVVRHPDGTVERWNKVERPKVRQDEFGRATHLYLAVIDCPKDACDGTTDSSSKAVVIPLTVGRRLAILDDRALTDATREIRVEIKAEPGFDPLTAVDVDSLTFGAPREVDYGRGCRARASARSGANLVVTFDGAGHGLKPEDFAAKLIGRTKTGDLLFGYARLPGVVYQEPMLVARTPRLTRGADGALTLTVPFENVGLADATAAAPARIVLREPGQGRTPGKEVRAADVTVPALKSHGVADTELVVPAETAPAAGATGDVDVLLHPDTPAAERFLFKKVTLP